jgi:hypothetical protein
MTKTEKSKLSDVWTTGHPSVTANPNQSGVVAEHLFILGSTREGMGVGPVLPQVSDLVRMEKR